MSAPAVAKKSESKPKLSGPECGPWAGQPLYRVRLNPLTMMADGTPDSQPVCVTLNTRPGYYDKDGKVNRASRRVERTWVIQYGEDVDVPEAVKERLQVQIEQGREKARQMAEEKARVESGNTRNQAAPLKGLSLNFGGTLTPLYEEG